MDAVDEVTDYVYSGLNVIDEIRGGAHEKHVYAGSMHLASVSGGAVENYHVDHLGSTRLKTNSNGGVIYESNYEPNGPGYGESGSEEFKYTGKHEDPSGLYYFGARYYNPEIGRFITEDPVLGSLEDPQGLNRYVYSRNNPLKYTDLDGRWIHIAAAALAGAVIKSVVYWNAHPGDWQGTIVHAAIGAGAGAFAAATFGTAALAMTAGETSMTAAVAGLGLGKTLVAGATSGVGGGFMERSISGPLCYLDAPGDLEAPTYSATEFGLDLAGGVIGATTGYGTGIIGSTIPKIRTALDIAIITGEVTEEYAALVMIESTVSEFMSRQTEYLSSRIVFEPRPYHDIWHEPWD